MRYILLFAIHLYWLLIPKNKRKRCLFKETCSKYVYRITRQQGLHAGIKALKDRKKKCRPGYYYINENAVRMADCSIVPAEILNKKIC
ncbi:membrane protein insertion efficiency factor YidD [Niabella hirudinis]|uniref:membrane protein insertion efficiency factor YidD n=1 Tax=Niabella hirudinis TaxID=1285929 RepID=UPI003EBB0AB2